MTPQQLAYNAYGTYLGQKIICTPYYDMTNGRKRDNARHVEGIVIGVEQSSVKVWCHDIYGVKWDEPHPEPFEYVKLKLKPLSSITDEEAIEICRIATYHPSYGEDMQDVIDGVDFEEVIVYGDKIALKHNYSCFIGAVEINYDGAIYMTDEEDESVSPIWHTIKIIDYLRSRGYNLPFMGYDLAKEGIVELIQP